MKYLSFLAFSAIMFTWMACGHGKPVDESETTGTTQPVTPAGSTTHPQTIPVDLNSQSTPSTITPSGSTGAGLNPEHGQPGHRCELAVGAPLNSKPSQPTTPAITSPSATTPPAIGPSATTPFTISSDKPSQPAATTPVAPGMNPAHGEPGHRCDIGVGLPLNSKPAQEPVSKETTPINISTDQPVKTEATTAVAPGMNPAHGQPGHRCDISVGAPLNSKPAAASVVAPTNNQIIPSIVPIKPTQDIKKGNR